MKKLVIVLLFLFMAIPAVAAHQYLEKGYQAAWCSARGGIQEYRLDDGARVDCLLPEYAVEFDFGYKWAECVGQAIYYGQKTTRTPACVLIIEDAKKDVVFVERLRITATKAGVKWWTIDKNELETERKKP